MKDKSIKLVSEKLAVVKIGNDKAIMHEETGKYIIITGSGAHIWDMLCEKEYTVNELLDELNALFTANEELIEKDTLDFLGKLSDLRIIELI